MNVEIHLPAVRVDTIENEQSNRTVEQHTPTTVVIRKDVTENPNFDYYLQPLADLLYDYLSRGRDFSYGGVEYQRTTAECSIEFDCYPYELRAAAQKRADEDRCHEVQVLADWTYRAGGQHHKIARRLQSALNEASAENPDAQYCKEIGGGADLMEDTTDGSLGSEK
jgi:putative hemolysin